MEQRQSTQVKQPRSSSKESTSTTTTISTSTAPPSTFGGKANNKLYDVFRRFDKGDINADAFITQVETQVGVKPTEQFINYVRTEKNGKCNYSKIAHTLNYNMDKGKNSSYVPPVSPYDMNFHRAKRVKVAGPEGSSLNAFQQDIGQTLQSYTLGNVSSSTLRSKLAEYNVNVDAQLDKLLRKHESGDFVSFNEFGTQIFRQLNGSDVYNRVDKINMNNPKIVSPEKTGKKPFAHADELKQLKSREIDDLYIERQERHLGGAYVPRKGGDQRVKGPGVNQMESSIGAVINSSIDHPNFDTISQASAKSISNCSIYFKEQQGSDIFRWKTHQEDPSKQGKKRVAPLKESEPTGNFLYWSTK